jgi:NAD+ synthase (glutamine-hydrolysing)
MQYGFIKVAAAVPTVKVADCQYNLKKIESLIAQAEGQGVEIITFPELCLTGYTCQDLFRQELLLQASETAIFQLLDFTRKLRVISIVGLPLAVGDLLLNCAVVIQAGQVMGVVPKTYLPNYSEFYEKRWFSSAQDLRAAEVRVAGNKIPISSDPLIFCTSDGVKFGIEICEDVWAPTPPSNHLALAGADIIFNLSASNELIGKRHYLMSLLKLQSARTITGYVYASAGFGESTQDLVYGGHAFIYENGSLLAEGQRFAMEDQLITTQIDVERLRGDRRANTTYTNAQRSMIGTNIRLVDMHSACQRDFVLERDVDPQPFIPKDSNMQASCQEIIDIQSMGLVKRLGRSFVELVGNSEYEMLDESLWHTCINTIHRHVVAIVSSPAQSKFREVASTNNHTTKLIAEVHKNLRTLTSLRILVGNIMNIRIVTNILEMLHYTLGNRNLVGCYSKRIHKVYGIIVSTVGSAEAWHRDTDDTLTR